MGVALRSDPITHGDLQDALRDAGNDATQIMRNYADALMEQVQAYRDDIRELMDVIEGLRLAVDVLTRESAA